MKKLIGLLGGLTLAATTTLGTASAAPPGSEVQQLERLSGWFASTSEGGYTYAVDLAAERWTQDGNAGMFMYVHVAVFDPGGHEIEACDHGQEVDPGILAEFEDDASHGFLFGTFDGGECFWRALNLDAHWEGDGALLRGGGTHREPGRRCSSKDVRREAIIHANFGFDDGPEGPIGTYVLDVNRTRTGEIYVGETKCHLTGTPGPA